MKSLFALAVLVAAAQAQILGFSPASAKKQAAIEKQYFAIPNPASEKKFHRWLTAEPHPAGSVRNNELAREIADIWRKQGLEDVAIRQYDVLVSEPREVSLELVAPAHYKAGLREEAYDVDPDTKNPRVKSA